MEKEVIDYMFLNFEIDRKDINFVNFSFEIKEFIELTQMHLE